jgi:hypothetical protein
MEYVSAVVAWGLNFKVATLAMTSQQVAYSKCTEMGPMPGWRPTVHLVFLDTRGRHFQPTGGPMSREWKKGVGWELA